MGADDIDTDLTESTGDGAKLGIIWDVDSHGDCGDGDGEAIMMMSATFSFPLRLDTDGAESRSIQGNFLSGETS